ncbi:MAG: hypothetical protein ACOYLP_11810, partial [Flavobacterium sp.]|uniref:hypothetical protein n=1 Tax=Flavobacterium sp. TaxID=239 RepID=UPI003BEBB271
MKTFKILFICLFLSNLSALAQFGNINGNRIGGVDRSNQIPQSNEPKEPTPEEIANFRNMRVDNIMKQMKEDLTLDELQCIAIRNELIANSKSIEILIKSEISEEDKTKQFESIQEKTEKIINSYMNSSQKEKYKIIKEKKA